MIGQDHEEELAKVIFQIINYNLSVGQTSAWFHNSEANDPDFRSTFPIIKHTQHNSLSQK